MSSLPFDCPALHAARRLQRDRLLPFHIAGKPVGTVAREDLDAFIASMREGSSEDAPVPRGGRITIGTPASDY